jgi:hypothetical protein
MTMAQTPQSGRPPKIATAAQVNGTWRVKQSYFSGEFRIWALGNRKLKVEFDGSTKYLVNGRSGGYSEGSAGGTAHIEGDTAILKPDDTTECVITMKFVGLRLRVSQDGGWQECGMGTHTTANGVYRRVSRNKPKFFDSVSRSGDRPSIHAQGKRVRGRPAFPVRGEPAL